MPRRSIYSTQKNVGVIFSQRDLHRAKTLRSPPDLFELRLDALAPVIDEIESVLRSLKTPLIITARHPREGGVNNLNAARRATLLERFADRAAYIDIELRALGELASVARQARRRRIGLIISVHDFANTPSVVQLRAKASAAASAGADIFKIATRTDTRQQLERLLQFFDDPHACRAVAGRRRVDLPISAMGIGRLGREARIELAARGSVLNYVHLGRAQIAGQFSLTEWRKRRLHLQSR